MRNMREKKAGSIITFTSTAGLEGSPGQPNYGAAKAAILGLTFSCANALAKYNITTNAIMPGVIETRHHEAVSTPEQMADYRRQTPLGRNGTADEVARAILFRASDASSFLNGALIDINGGRFLR